MSLSLKKNPKDPFFNFVSREPRLSEKEIEDLFIHILRIPDVFDTAVAKLDQFYLVDEPLYRALINACKELADNHGITPRDTQFKQRLIIHLNNIAAKHPQQDVEEAVESLVDKGSVIHVAFKLPVQKLSADRGLSLLKRFLRELTVISPLKAVMQDKESPEELAQILETIINRMHALEGIGAQSNKTIGQEWEEHKARLQQYRDKDRIGLRTGMKELDSRTLGLRGVIILGAKPGAGKTSFACVQVAVGVCRYHADNDAVVLVIGLDMDRFEIYRRINSHLGEIEWRRLMFGSPEETRLPKSSFNKADKDCIRKADEKLLGYGVAKRGMVLDRSVLGDDITAQRLISLLTDLKKRAGAKRALLVIDYLQLLPVPEDVAARGDLAADKYRIRMIQQVIENTRTKEDPLGDTALVISEARKPGNSKGKIGGWGDSMSDLMGSARLPYAADAVLLYREMDPKEMEKYYGVSGATDAVNRREQLKAQGISPIMLILEKGRDGMIRGKWGTEFHFNKSLFVELQSILSKTWKKQKFLDEEPSKLSNGSSPGTGSTSGIPLPNHLKKGKTTKKGKVKKATNNPLINSTAGVPTSKKKKTDSKTGKNGFSSSKHPK